MLCRISVVGLVLCSALLQAPLDVQAAPRDAVLAAGQAQDRAAVARALAAGAPVDARDADGWSALMFAAAAGDVELMRLLLRSRADANQRTNDGQTPLFAAVVSGKADAVRMLLQAGARADMALPGGKTPLMLASERRREDLVALLQVTGASRAKAELAAAAAAPVAPTPPPAPPPALVPAPVVDKGLPENLIRAFLLDMARLEDRQTAVDAARTKIEGRERESELERQRLAASARERYDTCLARVKSCESNCQQRAVADVLGAVRPAAGRGRAPTVDTQAMLSASQEGDSCRVNCAQSAACESIKP